MDAERLREELQQGVSADLRRRRGIVGLSVFGVASMTAVTLLQTGMVSHLPDPPLAGFDSDRVNSSETAYRLGVPDGALSLASLAANIPIAAFGGEQRANETPLVPLGAAVKAGIEAAVAAWYFYQMPAKEKAWCGYCIAGMSATLGVFLLTIPEAARALRKMRKK